MRCIRAGKWKTSTIMADQDFQSGDESAVNRPRATARESGLIQRLRRSFVAIGGERPGRVLVGFSGGADSLTLLDLLVRLGRHEGFEVGAIHVDHGVRGESSADATAAHAVAGALGVELDVQVVPVESLARHTGVGREEAMRRERYRAFSDVASSVCADVVALAHHQRDQAETVLLHLLRGSGIRGASGMRQVTTVTVPWWEDQEADDSGETLRVWRPLLDESVDDVRFHAESLGVPIIDDVTNADVSYRRNAIRHEVLPLLERIAPGATANLARFAMLVAMDSDELDRQTESAFMDAGEPGDLDRQWLLELPVSLQGRVVQLWIRRNAPAGLEVSLNRIEEVLRVTSVVERTRVVEIGRGVSVRIERNTLVIDQGQ